MHRNHWTTAAALLAGLFLAQPAAAQTRSTLVVAGPAAVMDAPRGDSTVIGQVTPGAVVEVLDRFDAWFLVSPSPNAESIAWQQGWIHVDALQMPGGRRASSMDRRLMVRGFGQAGGLMFNARNSFEAILGNTVNSVYGAGAQVVLPNGVYGQVSIDRVRKTGSRALVSGTQVYTLPIPNRLTVTPLQVTAGYRVEGSNKIATYFGGGVGWHTLDEDSPADPNSQAFSKRWLGYHVAGGVEYPVLQRWLWVGGEVQWATVPKALGETGVTAVFGERDLGGTTFSLKMMVGY
jgi:hypothetical protein